MMRKTGGIVLGILFVWLCVIPVHAQEDGGVIVKDRASFYREVSKQILSHQESKTYITDVGSLGNDLDELLKGYYYHYDADNPTASGSYLCYYMKNWGMNCYEGGRYADGHNCKMDVQIAYKYPKEEVDAYFVKMKEVAKTLKQDTDYKSVKAVHDYLIRNYTYDCSMANRSDYEGYETGKMVCQGYCTAAFYLLSEMGISARVVLGASEDYQKDTDHAWNVVRVDGKWYNMDVTWDDSGWLPDYTFFLKNDADFYKHTREGYYDYDKDMALSSYPVRDPKRTIGGCIIFLVIIIDAAVIIQRKRQQQEAVRQQVVLVEDDFLEESFTDDRNKA